MKIIPMPKGVVEQFYNIIGYHAEKYVETLSNERGLYAA